MSLNIKNNIQKYPHTTITKIDSCKLRSDVLNIELSPIYNPNNPEYALNCLISSLGRAIQNNTTVVNLPKRQSIVKPWITPGLLRCMRVRDKLHQIAKKTPNDQIAKITYTRYRNLCNVLLRKIKMTYEKNLIINAQSDNKNLWKVIKNLYI